MSLYIVVAEKGSVAKALRSFFTNMKINAVVTSVRGHVFEADLPLSFRNWNQVDPSEIFKISKVVTVIRDKEAYNNLQKIFRTYQGILVIATDNDHEGELIGFEILSIYRSVRGPLAKFYRMRFNSVSKSEFKRAWANLENDLNWKWVDKAIFRRDFDLITGASFTRLLTLESSKKGYKGLISWGSCQTCTLYFIVEREKQIQNFKPEKYWYLRLTLEKDGIKFKAYSDHIKNRQAAIELYNKIKSSSYTIVKDYSEDLKIIQRPLPLRTDDALKDLTKITKLSASKILSIMEKLYSEGYISYPRTDTNKYRSDFDFFSPLLAVRQSGILGSLKINGSVNPRNGDQDDGAHPPIYPISPYKARDAAKPIWDYIAKRFVANAFMDDAILVYQKAELILSNLIFRSEGKYIKKEGFLSLYDYFKPKEEKMPILIQGEKVKIIEIKLIEDETKPPSRLSESELLDLMEKHGIGTDATRAIFPSLIVERGFAIKQKGVFKPTALGISLIEALKSVDERLVTPATRKMVEDKMKLIEMNKLDKNEALISSLSIYHSLFEKCKSRIDEISTNLVKSIKK
jgi:DNA topoisomerase IA